MSGAGLDIRIAGRYRMGRKIGSGSFGDIYLGALCCSSARAALSPCQHSTVAVEALQEAEVPRACPGVHIQTGEEVGIKLVGLLSEILRASSCPPGLHRPCVPCRRA